MYKCLVSGGCSFAYGFNLKDRDKRYSKILAQHLNVELIDVSAAGMTNEFISAATISGITKALEKYSPEEILVVVGWTTTERFEYFNKKIGRIMSGYVNLTRHMYGDKHEEDVERSQLISKYLWDPSYGYYKLIHSFNYLHTFCKEQRVTVIHKHNVQHHAARFPSIKLLHTDVHNNDLIDRCFTADTKKRFQLMTIEKSFQLFTMESKYVIDPKRDTHPNEQGHILWAERLMIKHPELRKTS